MTKKRFPAEGPLLPIDDERVATPDASGPPATDRSREVVAYIDGGSRGNPGPAGFGVVLQDADGRVLTELRESLGITTNNVAEYRGLIAALACALQHGYQILHIRSDSQLLVRQMLGQYRVKHPNLQPLHREARDLAVRLRRVTYEHVPREENTEADRLANEAMDEAASRSGE